MLTNLRDAFRGQSSPKHVMYGFLLVCYNKFVPKMRRFFSDIHSTSKYVFTLKSESEVIQGH